MAESDGGWAEEVRLHRIHWAGGIAQHAVDTHAELPIVVHFLWRLAELMAKPNGCRCDVLSDDVGLHFRQLAHKVFDVDHQVTYDREVSQWLDAHLVRIVVTQESRARELGSPVDHHAAAPAHAHVAGPAER